MNDVRAEYEKLGRINMMLDALDDMAVTKGEGSKYKTKAIRALIDLESFLMGKAVTDWDKFDRGEYD